MNINILASRLFDLFHESQIYTSRFLKRLFRNNGNLHLHYNDVTRAFVQQFAQADIKNRSFALLVPCAGHQSVTGAFPAQRANNA